LNILINTVGVGAIPAISIYQIRTKAYYCIDDMTNRLIFDNKNYFASGNIYLNQNLKHST